PQRRRTAQRGEIASRLWSAGLAPRCHAGTGGRKSVRAPLLSSRRAAAMSEPLLSMTGIGKRFPGVQALDQVDFEVAPGEIHALLGENGAGKSTLLKILSGAQQPDAGAIRFAGEAVALATPHAAQRLGIVTIYQEFTLAPNMTIAENVWIGREPGARGFVNWRRMEAETRDLTHRLGLDLRPTTLVRDLSVAEQ